MTKREDYISWDDYFMGIAMLAAKRSKDPNTQVGACIVSGECSDGLNSNTILSVGYNGLPIGCSDDEFPWDNKGKSLQGSKLYVALFPCNECCKAIIQSGIREIIFLSDKYAETDAVKASKRMFSASGVKLTKLKPSIKKIELSLDAKDI